MNLFKKSCTAVAVALVLVLSSCGAKFDVDGFTTVTNDCVTAQNALLMKQSSMSSGDFETLSKGAKDLVASPEFSEWKTTCQKVADFDISAAKGQDLVDAEAATGLIGEYISFMSTYFESLAEAKDADEYNAVNEKMATEMGELEDKLMALY